MPRNRRPANERKQFFDRGVHTARYPGMGKPSLEAGETHRLPDKGRLEPSSYPQAQPRKRDHESGAPPTKG